MVSRAAVKRWIPVNTKPFALYYIAPVTPANVPTELTAVSGWFDVTVIEPYTDPSVQTALYNSTQVATMRAATPLLLAYWSIGEAENYRWYWSQLVSADHGPVDPQFPGDYEVAYWGSKWLGICQTACSSFVGAGFDGVYLDVVDEYSNAWAIANVQGGTAPGTMIALIKSLSSYVKGFRPGFQVWVNGGESLFSDSTYLAAIDGCYKENVYYNDSGVAQTTANTNAVLDAYAPAFTAGKPVAYMEYVMGTASQAAKIANVQNMSAGGNARSQKHGYYCGYFAQTPLASAGLIAGTPKITVGSPTSSSLTITVSFVGGKSPTFAVRRSPDGSTWTTIAASVAYTGGPGVGTTQTYVATGLSSATTYYFGVQTTNTFGTSAWSTNASGTTA